MLQPTSTPSSTQRPSGGTVVEHADHQFDQTSGKLVKREGRHANHDDASDDQGREPATALPATVPTVLPRSIGKATLDYVSAPIALLVLSPVFLVIAVYIKLVSRGPVFFRHRRFGVGEQSFRVWKFRTMSASTDPSVHARYVQSLVDGNEQLNKTESSELIPLGGLIRDLGLDELPQLLNIVVGQMSLVGPRPDVFEPTKLSARQRMRYQVLPGITGLWQISGKNGTTFEQMIDLDVRYVQNHSLALDLKVLFSTPVKIMSQFVPEKYRKPLP